MPGYKGHLTGGLTAFGITYVITTATKTIMVHGIIPVVGLLICTLAGALFPDIDIKSKGQKYFYWMICISLVYLFYYKLFVPLAYVAIAATTPMLVKHRGLFHNVWFLIGGLGALSYALVLYVPKYEQAILAHTLFFFVGALSHLWLDFGFERMFRFR